MNTLNQVELVATALQSIYARQSHVSVYQFVNRLILLFQSPIIFLFYTRDSHNRYELKFHTHQDILFQDKFYQNVIKPLHESVGKNSPYFYREQKPEQRNTTTNYPEHPYPIKKLDNEKSSDYYFILIKVEKNDKDHKNLFFSVVDHCQDKVSEDTNLSEILLEKIEEPYIDYIKLKCLWLKLIGENKSFSSKIGIYNKINESLRRGEKKLLFELRKEEVSQNQQDSLSGQDKEYISYLVGELKNNFNLIYESIYSSPVVSFNSKSPPNILFFLKYYGDNHKKGRYGEKGKRSRYNYSLRIIIPDKQREHLSLALDSIREATRDGKTWTVVPKTLNGDDLDKENNQDYYDGGLAEKFWYYIKNTKSQDILKHLEQPFGENARSVTDSVLTSGFAQYKKYLAVTGGVERIEKKEWDNEIENSNDNFNSSEVRRVVIFHYLLSVITPSSQLDTLSTFTIPIRISYTSYCAVLYACLNKDEDFQWNVNYHLFRDVSKTIADMVEIETKRAYLEAIELNIEKEVRVFLGKVFSGSNNSDIVEILENVNNKNKLICRVFPFPEVKIKYLKGVNKKNKKTFTFADYNLYVELADNNFYEVSFKSKDIDSAEYEVMKAVSSAFALMEQEGIKTFEAIAKRKQDRPAVQAVQ